MECGYITDRQIEASRIAMTRFIKRGGKVWLRLFPDKPITKKPAETRMGKGKGAPDHWVAVVRPGKILFEMEGVTPELAKEAMRLAAHKLPLKTSFVMRHDCEGCGSGEVDLFGRVVYSASNFVVKREEQWNSAKFAISATMS